MESLNDYLAARAQFVNLDAELDDIGESLRDLGLSLLNHRRRTYISDTPPTKVIEGDGFFNTNRYPDIKKIQETLLLWEYARVLLLGRFAQLPNELRDDLNAPPGINERDLEDYR